MKFLFDVLRGLGFICLMIGGSAMDSTSMTVPAILALTGILVILATCKLDNSYVWDEEE